MNNIEQADRLSRASVIKNCGVVLSNCATTCNDAQYLLSRILSMDISLSDDLIVQAQSLDRLWQQLDDIARILNAISNENSSDTDLPVSVIENEARLSSTKYFLLGQIEKMNEPIDSDNVDLF